jgi:hypothetical protein
LGRSERQLPVRYNRACALCANRRRLHHRLLRGQESRFLKNGAHLLSTDTGSIDPPRGQGGFASLITFGGGSGKMSAASGQIRLRGEIDAAEAAAAGDCIGTLRTR